MATTTLKINNAQAGWYLVDLATMTGGSGSAIVREGSKVLVELKGTGVRKTHGQQFFNASSGDLSIEITGKGIIHGPLNVQIDSGKVLSSTWVISSEDYTDNDYNDYSVRLTRYMSAG
jgi:hypothetical protein